MNYIGYGATLYRYWRMTQDPRTPTAVRVLVYTAIALTLTPKRVLPKQLQGLGLLDEVALVPAVIAAAVLLIPKSVKDDHHNEQPPKSLTS